MNLTRDLGRGAFGTVYVATRRDDVETRRDDVTTRRDDVETRRDDVAMRCDDVATRRDDVTTPRDHVETRRDDVTGLRDDVATRRDDVPHQVAVKRLEMVRGAARRQQIRKNLEELVLLRLSHPNVVRLLQVVEQDHKVWVVMELCNHGDLLGMLGDHNNTLVPLREKLRLMLDVAKGVAYLHSNNVIHRDIKPSNVVISGPPTVAKVTDFDLCKFLDEDDVTSRMTSDVGTDAFKAPEFYMRTADGNLRYHRNVDVFAMGLTFLAMIQGNKHKIPKMETGLERGEETMKIGFLLWHRKMNDRTPLEVVRLDPEGARVEGDPDGDVIRSLRGVLHKMTCFEPADRTSAAEVVRDLQEVVNGRAVPMVTAPAPAPHAPAPPARPAAQEEAPASSPSAASVPLLLSGFDALSAVRTPRVARPAALAVPPAVPSSAAPPSAPPATPPAAPAAGITTPPRLPLVSSDSVVTSRMSLLGV